MRRRGSGRRSGAASRSPRPRGFGTFNPLHRGGGSAGAFGSSRAVWADRPHAALAALGDRPSSDLRRRHYRTIILGKYANRRAKALHGSPSRLPVVGRRDPLRRHRRLRSGETQFFREADALRLAGRAPAVGASPSTLRRDRTSRPQRSSVGAPALAAADHGSTGPVLRASSVRNWIIRRWRHMPPASPQQADRRRRSHIARRVLRGVKPPEALDRHRTKVRGQVDVTMIGSETRCENPC